MYDAQVDAYSDFEVASGSAAGFRHDSVPPAGQPNGIALHSALFVGMLDEIDYGLIVLGADGRILHANQLARLELDAERIVRRRRDRLTPNLERHVAQLEAALKNVGRGQRSLVTLSGTDGELALSFVPLNCGAHTAPHAADAPYAMVILGKRAACEALTLQQYGRLHGLTGAEQALLPAITRGLSVEAIAQQQCVALCTVRTQLGSIRDKTGADSLRTLMARLTSLPPIRPALKQAQTH